MKEKEKWTPPETAMVYERSMQQEIENRRKIPMSESEIKIYERICDETFRKLVDSSNSKETLKVKKENDVLAKIRSFLRIDDAS